MQNVRNGNTTPEQAKERAIDLRRTFQTPTERDSLQLDAIDYFIENIASCAPATADPCKQAISQMEGATYPGSKQGIATIKTNNKAEIEEIARDFRENINTPGADKKLYKELSGLVQKCADSIIDPCQETVEKMEKAPRIFGRVCEAILAP